MFAAIYDSPLHVPVIPWVVAALVLVASARLRGFLRAFAVVFALEIAADAWLTGPWSPLPEGSRAATFAAILFVVLGDLRFFLLRARARLGSLEVRALASSLALSLVVPLATQALRVVSPDAFSDLRRTFLLYEVLFFVFVGALALIRPVPAERPRAAATLSRRLTAFELAQYGLWAAADALILASGADGGFLLRIAPNLMYYALFLPFAVWAARAAEAEVPS